MPTEVRLVAVGVGLGAPGRGSVGVVGHGHSGVVGVPRVRVGQEEGCCMVVVAAGKRLGLIAVRATTPRPGLRRRDGDRSERGGLYLR